MNLPQQIGLGDAIHWVLIPMAKLLHREGCQACACRRSAFNDILPNINPVSVAYQLYWSWKACGGNE